MSAVYAFFHSKLKIEYGGRHLSHVFKCQGKGCKTTICQFLDTKDAKSTGNMQKHVQACSCWGKPVLAAANEAANVDEVCTKIVDGILKNGSITEAFERKGKGRRTYPNQPLTCAEIKADIVRWVCIFIRPFDVISNESFHYLMKSGQPNMYVPSTSTVSRDVWLVFTRTCQRIARMLNVSQSIMTSSTIVTDLNSKEYPGHLSFTMDAWTSPNHRAYVAILVHLENKGTALSMILDIVEVAEVHGLLTWLHVFILTAYF